MKYRKWVLLKEMSNASIVNICTEGNGNFSQKGSSKNEWV